MAWCRVRALRTILAHVRWRFGAQLQNCKIPNFGILQLRSALKWGPGPDVFPGDFQNTSKDQFCMVAALPHDTYPRNKNLFFSRFGILQSEKCQFWPARCVTPGRSVGPGLFLRFRSRTELGALHFSWSNSSPSMRWTPRRGHLAHARGIHPDRHS